MGGVDPQGDEDAQSGEVDGAALPHSPLQQQAHQGKEGDDPHLGVVAGVGKAQEGGGRHVGHPAPGRRSAAHPQHAQVGVDGQPGDEHGQDVAPGQMALVGGEQVDETRGKVLGAKTLGQRVTAHSVVPRWLGEGLDLLSQGLPAPVKIGAYVMAEDDAA